MYSSIDRFERTVAFRAQELRTADAIASYRSTNDIGKFITQSKLSLMDPAFHDLVLNPLRRGNYPVAIREHAKLFSDVVNYDYTNAAAPHMYRGVWGHFFGQYGLWAINTIENFHAMIRWGSPAERAQLAARYAASATALYAIGSALGVKTSEWIPFVHSTNYTGGPGLDLVAGARDLLRGDPETQERFISDIRHDPLATLLSPVAKNLVPAGDMMRVFAAQANIDRRRRRLLGIPRPIADSEDFAKRVMGFRPANQPDPRSGPAGERLLRYGINQIVEP